MTISTTTTKPSRLRARWAALLLLATTAGACSRAAPPAARPASPIEQPGRLVIHGGVYLIEADGTRRAAIEGPISASGKIVTGPGGRAILSFEDGSRVVIEENDELAWAGTGSELTITPGRAALVTHTPTEKGGRAFELSIKTPFGVARVPDDRTEVAIEVDKRRVAFDLRLGDIGFTNRAGKHIELRMGSRIEVLEAGIEIIRSDGTRSKLDADAPEPPAPRSAAAEGHRPAPRPLPAAPAAPLALTMGTDLRVYGDPLTEVTLTWPAGLDPATVEVARDQRFANVVMAGHPEGDHVNVTPPRSGSLYWRVLDAHGAELRRAKAHFGGDPAGHGAGAGAAQATVTESVVAAKLYYQSALPAVTFAFTPHPRAVRYNLRVAVEGGRSKIVVDHDTKSTRHTVRTGVLREGQYLWRVTPIDADGKALGEPRANRLAIAYDNTQVQLVIDKPRSGQAMSGPRVAVQGVAPPSTKLFVNGQRAPLDDQGRFDFQIDSAPALVFRLVTADGNERLWVRGLKAKS